MVTKNVSAYEIRKRFDVATAEWLQALKRWNRPEERIRRQNLPYLKSGEFEKPL